MCVKRKFHLIPEYRVHTHHILSFCQTVTWHCLLSLTCSVNYCCHNGSIHFVLHPLILFHSNTISSPLNLGLNIFVVSRWELSDFPDMSSQVLRLSVLWHVSDLKPPNRSKVNEHLRNVTVLYGDKRMELWEMPEVLDISFSEDGELFYCHV